MALRGVTLTDALGLPERGALVSIVGGGGKSALLFALGARLPARVVLTTTTRIFAAQITRAVASTSVDSNVFERTWERAPSGLLVIGRVEGQKAYGVDASLPARWCARDDVRHVIVEADGSRMRPAKAPADHEPAIAEGSTHVAIVVGIDALEGPIAQVCHRPDRVCALLGASPGDVLDTAMLARLLVHPLGGTKGITSPMRSVVVINKVEGAERRARAQALAEAVREDPRIDRVIIGALEGPDPDLWLRV